MDIGKFIKEARIDMGLSQEELAEKSKCQRQHINRIENGKTDPKYNDVVKILEVLGYKTKHLKTTKETD